MPNTSTNMQLYGFKFDQSKTFSNAHISFGKSYRMNVESVWKKVDSLKRPIATAIDDWKLNYSVW